MKHNPERRDFLKYSGLLLVFGLIAAAGIPMPSRFAGSGIRPPLKPLNHELVKSQGRWAG